MTSANLSTGSMTPFTRLHRELKSHSYERLEALRQDGARPNVDSTALTTCFAPLQDPVKAPFAEAGLQTVSRVELLLAPRNSKPKFVPVEDASAVLAINDAIKSSSHWTDVRDALSGLTAPSAGNLAFSLYRLGCISAFSSRKRKKDLELSGLVPRIINLAMSKIDHMEPSSLVLLLDGCARLQHRPPLHDLTKIANLLARDAATLDARQLPLVLWAFAALHFKPGAGTAAKFEKAVSSRVSELATHGLALVLSGFQAAQHAVAPELLERLALVIQRQLLLFKPSELAICLQALSALGLKPSHTFLQAVAEHTGQSWQLQNILQADTAAGLTLMV